MAVKAVFISPHLDDAIFSAGALMVALAAKDWESTVITCFTKSIDNPQGFALECQLDKNIAQDVDYMALRRNEDSVACNIVGAKPIWLPYEEAPHRGYSSAAALFGPIHPGDNIVKELVSRLVQELKKIGPDIIFSPVGIGNHVDHLHVCRAVKTLKGNFARLDFIAWYDQPYLTKNPAGNLTGAAINELTNAKLINDFLSLHDVARFVANKDHLALKFEACAAYRSQVGFQFGGLEMVKGSLGEVEYFGKNL